MITITHAQIPPCLAVCKLARLVPHLQGPPGSGKTMGIQQFAAAAGVKLFVFQGSILSEVDMMGVPIPVHETKSTHFFPPDFWPRQGPAILFLDEMDRASEQIQNALTRLLLERRCGDFELPANVWLVAATNGATDSYTTPLSEATRQRLCHLYVRGTLAGWRQYMTQTHGPAAASVVSFVEAHPEHLAGAWTPDDLAADYQVRTRCLDALARAETAAAQLAGRMPEVESVMSAIAQGLLGYSIGLEYIAHRATAQDIPTADEVYRDPSHAKIPQTPSGCYAIAALLATPNGEHIEARMAYARRLPRDAASFLLSAWAAHTPRIVSHQTYTEIMGSR